MTTNTMTRVQVGDEYAEVTADAAQVITKALKRRERAVAKARKELDAQTAQNAKDAAGRQQKLDTLTARSAVMQAQLTTVQKKIANIPDEQQRLVTERLNAIQKADAIFGEARDWSAESTENIRRFVVLSEVGDVARGWGDSEIQAAFDTVEVPKRKPALSDGMRQQFDAFSGPPSRPRAAVKQQYDHRITNAWKDTVH